MIIDDEAPARSRLARMLRDALAGRVELVGEASDGEAGLALIDERNPDLAFVDVQLLWRRRDREGDAHPLARALRDLHDGARPLRARRVRRGRDRLFIKAL